jgi:hypothetical protein
LKQLARQSVLEKHLIHQNREHSRWQSFDCLASDFSSIRFCAERLLSVLAVCSYQL